MRAIARMAALAEAVGVVTFPDLSAAMWRIRVIGPLIRSDLSRNSAGALMISVFKGIIACDLDITALSRTLLMCRAGLQPGHSSGLAVQHRPLPRLLHPVCRICHEGSAAGVPGA